MTKRGFHESAQRTAFPREMGRGMPLKAVVGTQRQGLTGDSEVTSNHTVLGILGGILVNTSALGFQRSLFFTGVNTKDHSAQWATLLSHPQVRKELMKTFMDYKGGV